MPTIISKKWKQSYVERFQIAENLRIEDKFCDITLQSVDKVNVRAHKIILITGSRYFNDLFSSGMKESFADCIDYKLIKGDVLEKVISFMYTGELEIRPTDKIEEITVCANYFQLNELINECMNLLSELLNDSNCLKYWRLAHECFHREFQDQCISYVFESPNRIYENEMFFNELDNDELEILLKDVRLLWSEEEKFQRILQWTKEKVTTKEEFRDLFLKFMIFIDFASISEYVLPIILVDESILEHKEILKTIGIKCKKDVTRPLPKTTYLEKNLFALIDNEMKMISIDGGVITIHRKENSLRFTASTTFNNFLFTSGGSHPYEANATNICEYFDPMKREWNTFPGMLTSRKSHACTFLEDKIYVCGGYNLTKLSSVEIFDVLQEKWICGRNMKIARDWFGLTTTNRALYAVGGWISDGNDIIIEMFDPRSTTNGWVVVYKDEFTEENYTQCVSIGSDIYCFGWDNKPTIFDTKMNQMRCCDWWDEENDYAPIKTWPFKVCYSNEAFNVIQKNNDDSKYIDFHRYDFAGNIVCSKPKILNSFDQIETLVALNYL